MPTQRSLFPLFLHCLLFLAKRESYGQQSLIIDDSLVLKKGLYASFEDFKFNNPSNDTIRFTVNEESQPVGGILERIYIPVYEIVLANEESLTRKDKIWGFCDGRYVYRANNTEGHRKGKKYYRFSHLGRFCISDRVFNVPMPGFAGVGFSGGIAPQLFPFVLNINNGSEIQIDTEAIDRILKQDPEMYQKYKKDKYRRDRQAQYIEEYSNKHKEEIKR